jgi:ABC-type dipeptide/oligopeptide/nickel transport system ATPase subunit
MTRTFEDRPAVRENTPLLIGLFGVSGSGKTYSALRLATGIQRVNSGPIFVIDTEAKRALHYADKFKFHHVQFKAPFGPLDYLAAIEHSVAKGAKTIIIDSCSHAHEGQGGLLEMHEAELDRLAVERDGSPSPAWKRDSMNFPAWAKPKADHRRMVSTMLQLECSFILCFRAKEKIKLLSKAERAAEKEKGGGGSPMKQMGFMPIGDPAWIFEMTLAGLLMPGSNGVPTWDSTEPGEKMMTKLPEQFRGMFGKGPQLSEDLGEQMAKWAAGGDRKPAVDAGQLLVRYAVCGDSATLRVLETERTAAWSSVGKDDKVRLKTAAAEARGRIEKAEETRAVAPVDVEQQEDIAESV